MSAAGTTAVAHAEDGCGSGDGCTDACCAPDAPGPQTLQITIRDQLL